MSVLDFERHKRKRLKEEGGKKNLADHNHKACEVFDVALDELDSAMNAAIHDLYIPAMAKRGVAHNAAHEEELKPRAKMDPAALVALSEAYTRVYTAAFIGISVTMLDVYTPLDVKHIFLDALRRAQEHRNK